MPCSFWYSRVILKEKFLHVILFMFFLVSLFIFLSILEMHQNMKLLEMIKYSCIYSTDDTKWLPFSLSIVYHLNLWVYDHPLCVYVHLGKLHVDTKSFILLTILNIFFAFFTSLSNDFSITLNAIKLFMIIPVFLSSLIFSWFLSLSVCTLYYYSIHATLACF